MEDDDRPEFPVRCNTHLDSMDLGEAAAAKATGKPSDKT